jgi:hypothetical protein
MDTRPEVTNTTFALVSKVNVAGDAIEVGGVADLK